MAKRFFQLTFFGVAVFSCAAWAAEAKLSFEQSQAFRSWFVRIVKEQLRQGPNPRWSHKDCAGLVRFGVYEALKTHDEKWRKANAISSESVPPEVALKDEQRGLLNRWKQVGSKSFDAFAPAIAIIQENSEFVSKDINQARPGDLLFFDHGQDQHLMVWMGSFVAYHTGTQTKTDSGLRMVNVEELMHWKDTRWQTRTENPNYIGIYRLSFLSY